MSGRSLPLLAERALGSVLAWRGGHAISAGQFVAEAQALARQLPATARPINLCQDRYLFALGFAAALLRGQTSLMPPNALPETLRQLQGLGGAAAIVLSDDPGADSGGLPLLLIERPAGLAPAQALPGVAAELEAVCLLTSGSTGPPQPHAKTWGALVLNIQSAAERLAQHLQRADLQGLTLVATVPAQHSYGFESTVLLAMLGGAAFDAGRPFYPADIAGSLARVPLPRALVTTPFHLKTLLLAGVALPRTELTLSATAPLSPQLAAQAEAAFDGCLVEIYGCTEAGQVASRRTTAGEIWTTLGELQLSSQRQTTDDGSDGAEAFIVSGGHVLQPTALADVLELADERHFRLLGRANDLIHVAGKRSSLAHLNFHLNRIDGVEDGAFWLPDEVVEGVVRPLVFVVAPSLSGAQVIAGLRQSLESVFVPRRVVHVAQLPRAATGKLTAQALRQFALAALAAPAAAPQAPSEAVAAQDLSVQGEFTIGADHPAFNGHFPGQAVLPGVVLMSLVMQTLATAPELAARLGATPCIDSLKFLAPVGPDTRLQVHIAPQGGGLAFVVSAAQCVVARGQLSAALAAEGKQGAVV